MQLLGREILIYGILPACKILPAFTVKNIYVIHCRTEKYYRLKGHCKYNNAIFLKSVNEVQVEQY